MSNQKQADRVESVRNAWTRALRSEVVRVGKRLAKVGHVGVWLATYANADGSNAFPGRETLAALTGYSEETVSRCLQVLEAVRMVSGKRRPNAATVYQLVMPTERPDWEPFLHIVTETRQKRARAEKKIRDAEGMTVRTASPDALRTASAAGVPDSVPGGGSGQRPRTPSEDPDSVRGRPWTASTDVVRTASPAGGTDTSPTSGRDPLTHTNTAGLLPQPQVRARTRPENDQHAAEPPPSEPAANWTRCTGCGGHMYPRPGRPDHHAHCTPNAA